MNDLAVKVRATTPYFVRCVKPNSVKKPRVFENTDVAHQLRCAGVLEAIRIMRDMFPSRIPHAEFYRRFTTHEWKCAIANGKHRASFVPLPKNDFTDFEALKDCCHNLCVALDLNEDAFRVGRTKVFFRTGVLAQLEVRIQKYIFDCASRIRKVYLGMIARRKYKAFKKGLLSLCENKLLFPTLIQFCVKLPRSFSPGFVDIWPGTNSGRFGAIVLPGRSRPRGGNPSASRDSGRSCTKSPVSTTS